MIHNTVDVMMMQVHVNLLFPRIWEQDECRSTGPIEIGPLDVKFSYLV